MVESGDMSVSLFVPGGMLEPGSRPTCGPPASGFRVDAPDPSTVVLGTSFALLEHPAASAATATTDAPRRIHEENRDVRVRAR